MGSRCTSVRISGADDTRARITSVYVGIIRIRNNVNEDSKVTETTGNQVGGYLQDVCVQAVREKLNRRNAIESTNAVDLNDTKEGEINFVLKMEKLD